jgi:phage recombination protein Bet
MSQTTDIVRVAPQDTQLATQQQFAPEQLDLLKRTICKGSTDDEFALFMHVVKRTGLDPFAKQIYGIKRFDSDTGGEKMTFQTGIDGYRLIADRTGRYLPGREPTFVHDDKGNLISATAYVLRRGADGAYHECAATAHFDEYYQAKRDGSPTKMWATKPHVMLSKCAEALILRKAFPAEMSGVYTAEEMQQADVVDAEVVQATTTTRPQAAARQTPPTPAATQAAPQTPAPTTTQASQQGEPALAPEEQIYWLETWDAAVIERQLDSTAASLMLQDALKKLGATPEAITATHMRKCLDALNAGKWDDAIRKRMTTAQVAPRTTPAPATAQPTATITADDDCAIASIENWDTFQAVAAQLATARGVNDIAFANGIELATKNVGKAGTLAATISRPKLREWATAIAMGGTGPGSFDYESGKIRQPK